MGEIAIGREMGIRALVRDPEIDLARARRLVAEILADELGVAPGLLLDSS